ncbi:MAG: valine--tRNA ligase [Gammaproteobacteria bacterium]|nr:valine--tRNA ligase [Gammaproteobacteria bacterium]
MEASFNPHAIETAIYQEWEAAGHFAPKASGRGYCIVIPPPNVTGSLHMGHAFQHTLMDALIRHQRMRGRAALWQMGTDHAGISTQMLVERQLNAEGKTRHQLGRDRFTERVWQWKRESGGNISQQLRRMGSSLDWSRERFTLDAGFSRAVTEVFVRLHEEGLIYRGQRLVNWDPALGTAISDLEVINVEEQGSLWHFRYPLCGGARTADGKDHLVVATTRPETMLGDTAVAVHPQDERFRALIGQRARLPLVGRELPIIADEAVDPAFGSGCVKITPAHDFNDYEMGLRHGLAMINVLTAEAAINDSAPAAYRGLDRLAARQRIVADLDALGLLEQVQAHSLMAPRGDRSEAIIEPRLTDQWFVRIAPLAEPAIKAVREGRVEFVPKQYENTYFAWMRDIKDWCISRQQWWGHRIPAWYGPDGAIHVGQDEADARRRAGLAADVPLRQEEDVLETWFSSALWSFATLGWPERTQALARFHPTDVLVTGHDIIFFWVARMIMMALKFTGEVPFRQVYIHGLVRDAEGRKMSKTKGNGLDPLDLIDGIGLEALVAKRTGNLTQPHLAPGIEKATRRDYPNGIPSYGTDALRFTFCALASTGRDVRFDLARTEGYRNFCNKLWNAARFVLMNTEGKDLSAAGEPGLPDRWIRSRARRMVARASEALDAYRFDLYAGAIHEFAWREYCDWYLELAKPLLWDEGADPDRQAATRRTLLEVLELLLRAAHPVMPFITEAIWREVAPLLDIDGDTIMLRPFPEADDLSADLEADAAIDWLKAVVAALRNIRGEAGIKPGQTVRVLLAGGGAKDRELAALSGALVQRLAKVESIDWLAEAEAAPGSALGLVGELRILVPLADLIDLDAERNRLRKAIDRKRGELNRLGTKLANEKFIANAPPQVVEQERLKANEAEARLQVLEAQAASLG